MKNSQCLSVISRLCQSQYKATARFFCPLDTFQIASTSYLLCITTYTAKYIKYEISLRIQAAQLTYTYYIYGAC